MLDEYSSYTMMVNNETLSVNGITTQGENIADIGGYKESYRWSMNQYLYTMSLTFIILVN